MCYTLLIPMPTCVLKVKLKQITYSYFDVVSLTFFISNIVHVLFLYLGLLDH